jgi:hypothetical protein
LCVGEGEGGAYMPPALLQYGLLEDALALSCFDHTVHLVCRRLLPRNSIHSPLHHFSARRPDRLDTAVRYDTTFWSRHSMVQIVSSCVWSHCILSTTAPPTARIRSNLDTSRKTRLAMSPFCLNVATLSQSLLFRTNNGRFSLYSRTESVHAPGSQRYSGIQIQVT